MTTYADPTRCPDCRAVLPHDPQVCRVCSLPLTGVTAVSLFRTLQEADRLVGVLRDQKRPVHVPVGATTGVAPSGSLLEGVAPYPARPHATPTASPRISGPSVPRILLSLGALCLLVAAVIFLTFAWSWLGVGGRTTVLVALTGTALGLSLALERRGLRMAAESLAVIGLGLVALDTVGVRHAGWLGPVDDAGLLLLAGSAVATVALVMLVVTARRPLIAPALVAPFAVLTAGLGAQADVDHLLPIVVTVAVLIGLGRVGTVLPSRTLQRTSVVVASLGWAGLVLAAVGSLDEPITAAHYAGDLRGWPFLAATLLAVGVGPVTGMRRSMAHAGYSVAGLLGSYTVLMPTLDNDQTAMVSAVLVASVVWVGVVALAPRSLRPPALVPLAGTLVVPVVSAVVLVGESARALVSVGEPFSRPFDVHVTSTYAGLSPLLLVPVVITVAAAACAVAQLVEPVRRSTWVLALAVALAFGTVATLALYDVPLALIVGLLVVASLGGFVVAERLAGATADPARLVALVLITGAAVLALPSDRMLTGVLVVGCVAAGYLMTRADSTGAVAALCFPIAFTGLVWAGGNVVGVDGQFRAIPVLLVLGAVAIWRPQLELEASSALTSTLASAAAVLLAGDLYVSLAVHLTIAGVVVTATSIVHPSRRLLAWVGGILLAAATWVRLYDLGVDVPEAYTLPSALALVAVGAWRLHRDDRPATLTVLAPGLALATVPSLVAVLDDPLSVRALLLGAACLTLTVAGAVQRWSAPLVVGSVVGALLVLRELAPYAASVPTWVSIGLAGAVLLVVGVTWESRMNDVRRASRYVAALR